jgi:copper chaperone CopZ
MEEAMEPVRYRVTGMDCAADAAEIEAAARNVPGVTAVKVSTASQIMTLQAAAGLVAWTRSPWPDLAGAGIISLLFLHSSWSIVRDARDDLGEAE